jgi:hypothetical protein
MIEPRLGEIGRTDLTVIGAAINPEWSVSVTATRCLSVSLDPNMSNDSGGDAYRRDCPMGA